MPAANERQRRIFCIAQSIKEGKQPRSYAEGLTDKELGKRILHMVDTMSLEELKDYCESEPEGD